MVLGEVRLTRHVVPPVRLAALVAAACLLLGVLPLLRLGAEPDIAWLLHVGGRVLDGARYGVDVVEVNPPLIVWITMLPVAAARFTGLPEAPLYYLMVALLVAGAAAWCTSILRRHPMPARGAMGAWLGALTLALLALPPGRAFGQREHLAVVLALPYLLLAGFRSGGGAPSRREGAAAGIAAGVGFALKPYFLLPLLLVELSVRRRVTTVRPETVAILLLGVTYALAVPVIHPGWLAAARELAPLYRDYLVPTAGQFLGPGLEPLAGAAAAVVAWLLLARPRPEGAAWGTPLAAALAGFTLSAFVQWKPWPYLFAPVGILGVLMLAFLLVEADRSRPKPVARFAAGLAAVAAAALLLASVRDGVTRASAATRAAGAAGDARRDLVARVRTAAAGEPIAVLATNHSFGFPLALEVGTGWALRYPSLWPLVPIHAAELAPGPEPIRVPIHPPDPREARFLTQLAEDLDRSSPGVILIPTPAPRVLAWGYARRFDYEPLLRSDHRLAAILDRYELADSVGFFRLYSRRQPGTSVRQ